MNTEEQILESAKAVFIRKGFAAARMQEIADLAGINKSLLHYYFRSKDQLFEAVFLQAIRSFLPEIKKVLEAEMPLKLKIIKFVETYIDILLSNPHIPAFVIQELNTDPGRFVNKLRNYGMDPNIILKQIEEEAADGQIRPVRADHFMVNMFGLLIFPFVARPVVQGVLHKSPEEYDKFLGERKEQIIQFVMNAISIP